MEKIYLVTITETERRHYAEDDVIVTKKAFSTVEKAIEYLDAKFNKFSDFYDIGELSNYDYKCEDSFHIQENTDSDVWGDWKVDGEIEGIEMD